MQMPGWWRRLARWRSDRQGSLDRGLDDEVRFHLDQQIARNVRAGMTPAEARRAALIRFGGVEPVKEGVRDEFRPALFQDVTRDLRLALRILSRTPGFSALVLLTFALGVAASTTVFSVVDGVLLRPLPYPEADRIVRVFEVGASGQQASQVAEPNFIDWQRRTRSFSAFAEVAPWGPTPVLGGAEPVRVPMTVISRDFFTVMQVKPAVGRAFVDEEMHPGGVPAAIVSDTFWRLTLGGGALGDRVLRVNGLASRIVGVMPSGFDFPNGTAVWIPRELAPEDTERTAHNFEVFARLAPGQRIDQARTELSNVSRAMKRQYGDQTWMSDATAIPIRDQLTLSTRPALDLLFAASLLLLAVACTNASNLLIARAATRQQEFAVQLALGAGRSRLLRQLLAETAVLCLAGGTLGTLTVFWAVRLVPILAAGTVPRLENVSVNWAVLAFALGVSIAAAVVLAVVTAVGTPEVRPGSVLADSQRTTSGGRQGVFAREALVVLQVALTVVLLVGATLLGKSLLRVLAIDPGFRLDDALVVDMTGPARDNPTAADWARQVSFQDGVLRQVGALPGVTAAGLTTGFPLGGGRYPDGTFLEMTALGQVRSFDDWDKLARAEKGHTGEAGFRLVSDGYFETLGIPLIRGRLFRPSDQPTTTPVAVVSHSLADAQWPGQNPLGRYVQFGNMDGDLRGSVVVGVVGDVRELTTETPPVPLFYASLRQRPRTASRVSLVVRGLAPSVLVVPVRRIIHELDPDVPSESRTVQTAYDRTIAGRRFGVLLLAVFGGSALLVASLGLYGLVAFVVAQRMKEMGIRMALGATGGSIIRLFVSRGGILAALGGLLGLALSVALAGLIKSLVFEVSVVDPDVLALVAAVAMFAATLASYVPARRAARVDPVVSLRTS